MKYRTILPALLLATACSPSAETLAERASHAFAAHDYAAARLDLIEALKQQPGNRDLLLLHARTLIELGDGEGAKVALDGLLKGTAPQGELAELAANAALLRQAPDLVAELLAGNSSVEASRLRAMAALQKQNLSLAAQELDRAIAAGGSGRVYSDYARLMLIKGDLAKAGEYQAQADRLAGDQLGTLLTGGELALRRGDLAQALDRYSRADKAYPGNVAAMVGKASVLGDLGRFDQMQQVLGPLAAAAPKDPTVVYLQARLAQSRQDWNGIKALVQPVEAGLDPQDPIRLIYADALTHLGQAQQAAAQAAPIARANPANRLALKVLAEAQLAAGDARAAAETYRPVGSAATARSEEKAFYAKLAQAAGDPAAAQAPNAPSPKALMADLAEGDAAMRQGDWAKAATAYDHILAATDGKNVLVLNNQAYAQAMLGNHRRAIELADKALALAPDNASVMDTAGWVRVLAGQDKAKARDLLTRAAAKAPNNAAIKQHLARIG